MKIADPRRKQPIRLAVYVQPGASTTAVAGMHDELLKIRVAAPPVDNAANAALVQFVAAQLGVPKRAVRLAAGAGSRRKILEIDGVSGAEIAAAFPLTSRS